MTEAEKEVIARNFIKALSTRDGDLLKSIMTENVTWSLPGMTSGTAS